MASLKWRLVFLTLTLSWTGCFAVNEPTAALVCTDTGFTPSISLEADPVDLTDQVSFNAVLGTGGTGCSTVEKDVESTGTTTLDGNDLKGSVSEFLYGTTSSPVCGGTFDSSTGEIMEFVTTIDIYITNIIRGLLIRKMVYTYNLKCQITRVYTASGQQSYTVSSDLSLEEATVDKSDTFSLDIFKLEFYSDEERTTANKHDTDFELRNNEMLHARVVEGTEGVDRNAEFKFTVQKCFASDNSDSSVNTNIDTFLDEECPVDSTIIITPQQSDQYQYDFSLRAFYFKDAPGQGVYIHCEIYICHIDEDDAKCVQDTQTQCNDRGKRKRRNVEYQNAKLLLSSKQKVYHSSTGTYGSYCPDNYVFDRIQQTCDDKRLILVKGLRLDVPWDPSYANASSDAFKRFAKFKSYQLYSLIQTRQSTDIITGLQITRAMRGGVVVDLLVRYNEESSPEEAFYIIERALHGSTSEMNRVVELLKIQQEEKLEYIDYSHDHAKYAANITKERIVLIAAIVVALFGILLMIAILVRFNRRR